MTHHAETKTQTWQALAVFHDGTECLICLGRSAPQVRSVYAAACADRLDPAELSGIRRIALQRWQGATDQGRWCFEGVLPVPACRPAAGLA